MTEEDTIIQSVLAGKPEAIHHLFHAFLGRYRTLAAVTLYSAKTMTGISWQERRVAWILKPGKTFLDIVFPFSHPYHDNLCFRKIAQVPGSDQYNHHLRLLQPQDINDEIAGFMELSLK